MTESKAALHPKRMVNTALTSFVGSPVTARGLRRLMVVPFITGRVALADAADLLERYGESAGREAAHRIGPQSLTDGLHRQSVRKLRKIGHL